MRPVPANDPDSTHDLNRSTGEGMASGCASIQLGLHLIDNKVAAKATYLLMMF